MLLASLLSPNHCSPKIHKQWPFSFLWWLFTLGLYPSVSAPLCSPCVSHMVNRLRIWIMREWTPLLEYGSLLQRMNWEQLQQEVSIWERRSVQIDSDVHTDIDLSLGDFFLSYLLSYCHEQKPLFCFSCFYFLSYIIEKTIKCIGFFS